MPKPAKIPKRKRQSIIGSYRNRLNEPDLDQEIKDEIIRLGTFESQKDLYEQQLKEMRAAQREAFEDAQVEIDKIQREFELIEGGVFYVEDKLVTRHYYLEDQAPGNGNQNPGNPNK